jgi:lipopolysaccharide cholinephosphotransferase
MNELQKIELGILKSIDKICRENNITYYIAYGTALGAVRHKGFIPWDDDVDIIMLRDDYERFCSLPKAAFPQDLFLQTVYTDPEYPLPFAKIRKNNTAYVERGREKLHMHQGIFIDIFPLDYICEGKFAKLKQRMWAEYQWILMARNRGGGFVKRIIINAANIGCSTTEKYLKRIRKAEQHVINKTKTAKVTCMSYGGRAIYAVQYDTADFEAADAEFEGYRFPIMRGYDNFLRTRYGDYMKIPPEEDRVTHSPYYVSFDSEYRV